MKGVFLDSSSTMIPERNVVGAFRVSEAHYERPYGILFQENDLLFFRRLSRQFQLQAHLHIIVHIQGAVMLLDRVDLGSTQHAT